VFNPLHCPQSDKLAAGPDEASDRASRPGALQHLGGFKISELAVLAGMNKERVII
jgi:hypothetical protein